MNILKRIGLQVLSMFLVALSILGMWHIHGAKSDVSTYSSADKETKPLSPSREERVNEYLFRPMRL